VNRPEVTPLLAGLCSVTLRHLSADDVARVVERAGLAALEWGGDVHVPPGDRTAADRARAAAAAAGVELVTYGSYLVTAPGLDPAETARVFDTAAALGAAGVRVWCPSGTPPRDVGSVEPGVREALGLVAEEAAARGMIAAMEYHGGTLTATAVGTRALLDAVDHPALTAYWQPPYWQPERVARPDAAADLADLERLASALAHLHVYEWGPGLERRALSAGASRWRPILEQAGRWAVPGGGPRAALLEFVAGDDPERVVTDATTLRGWLADATGTGAGR